MAVSYETRPEVNLGSPIAPLLEIRKQAVIDATASHMFISANALPGHILAHIYQDQGCIRGYKFGGNTHRRPKPNINCFGSSGLPSMKRSGQKDSGSSYIPGFLVIPLRGYFEKEWAKYELVARGRLQTINLP